MVVITDKTISSQKKMIFKDIRTIVTIIIKGILSILMIVMIIKNIPMKLNMTIITKTIITTKDINLRIIIILSIITKVITMRNLTIVMVGITKQHITMKLQTTRVEMEEAQCVEEAQRVEEVTDLNNIFLNYSMKR